MAAIKNEHIVYAYYAPLMDGGKSLLLVGITDVGWEHLTYESGNFLKADPPSGAFSNVSAVWIVRGKDKAEIRAMIQKIGEQKGTKVVFAH